MRGILVLFLITILSTSVYGKEITVGEGKEYTDIQEAFNRLEDGDTLIIYPGEYGVKYDPTNKMFLRINSNNVIIKGVDVDGNDFENSDYVTNRIYQEEYIGNIEANGFIDIVGKNNSIEGVHLIRNIEGFPYLSVPPESNLGVNKMQMKYADSFYENTVFVPQDVEINEELKLKYNLEYYNRVAPKYKSTNLNTIEPNYSSELEKEITTQSDWSKDAYKYLSNKRFVSNYVYHEAKNDINRITFVRMLTYCYEDVNGDIIITSLPDFEDMDDNMYKYEIMKAYSLGFINGISDNYFGGREKLTREQAAIILMNLVMDTDSEYVKGNFGFKDDDKIASWAKDAVYYCYENGILSGDSNGYFNPKNNLKNEEAVVLAYNYLKFLEGK